MDFTFSEEQIMVADMAGQMFADKCSPADLRALMASGAARDDGRWQAIVDMGLMGVLAPEAAGGLGLTETDFVLVVQACGYAALPEPLIETAGVAVPLLAATGAREDVLAVAAAGAASLAVGHPANPFVADADTAAALLLHHEGEVHLVEQADARLTRETSIDPFRRLFRVDWSPSANTRIADDNRGPALWDEALDRGALFAAAQCLGLAQRSVDLAVVYAKERTQFGKPIGSYQAVKHLLANAQVKIEFAKPVVYAAAAQIGAHSAHSRARVSHAKLVAAEAADLGARNAIQVHGAMGYSWEVDVHFFLKRALALTYAWGEPAFHRARIEARLAAGQLGPEHTFAQEDAHHA